MAKGVKEKDINSWRRWYLTIMAICSITYAVLNTVYGSPNITVKGLATFSCVWVPNTIDKRFYANTIFEIICYTVSIVLFIHVIYICIKTSLSVQDVDKKPLRKIWKSYSMIFLFLALHIILYSITIFYLHIKLYYVDAEKMGISEGQWYLCLFTAFINENNTDYLNICGYTPSNRAGFNAYIIEMPIIYFTALVLLYITLYKEVREFWHNCFIKFLAYAGVKFVTLQLLGKKQSKYFSVIHNRASSIFSSTNISDINELDEENNTKNTIKPSISMYNIFKNPFTKKGKYDLELPTTGTITTTIAQQPLNTTTITTVKEINNNTNTIDIEQGNCSEIATERISAREHTSTTGEHSLPNSQNPEEHSHVPEGDSQDTPPWVGRQATQYELNSVAGVVGDSSSNGSSSGGGVNSTTTIPPPTIPTTVPTTTTAEVNHSSQKLATILSEGDEAGNIHSIYTTLPSFNTAADALIELANMHSGEVL